MILLRTKYDTSYWVAVSLSSLLILGSGIAQETSSSQKRTPRTQLTVTPLGSAMPHEVDLSPVFKDFWEAAANLYFPYVEHRSPQEASVGFMNALRAIYHGKLDMAEGILKEIATQTDEQHLRDHAHTLLVMIYQNEDKVEALLKLLEYDPSIFERGVIDPGEVASMRARMNIESPKEVTHFQDEVVTLPIKLAITGTPRLEIEINGVKEWFWLDTGASGTLIASDVAKAMNISPGEPFVVDNLSSSLTLQEATVDILKFGPMTLKNYRVAIINQEILKIAGRPILGIIGWPVLRRLRMEFNYANKTVTLQTSEMRENPDRNFFWFDYPFVRLMSPDGVPLNFGLDTGADATRFKTNLLKKLPDLEVKEVNVKGAALGRVASNRGQMLEKASFLVARARLDFRYIKTTPGVSARFIAPDGRLGVDVFRESIVLLDFPAGVFRITVPDGEP